jgi:mRNA interferase RelE/StbE
VTYSLRVLRAAQKQLEKIERQDRARLYEAIRELATNPRPAGTRKLSGRPAWRIRVGSFRVIYEIEDKQLVVLVVAIGNRRDIYR